MNPLIDVNMVECMRRTGKAFETLPDRREILEKHRLPWDRRARNVIVSGCQILSALPHVLTSLCRVFDRGGLDYTFLSVEYCCGNYLYRPAIQARDENALSECRQISRELVQRNIERAKELGAERLIIFCSPCYPVYRHAFPEENIVFYPAAIHEALSETKYPNEIDYYAGCYRLHRKFSPAPMDLKSTDEVFEKLEGLSVRRISAPKCCFTPEGLSHMIDSVRTKRMVHICTGCYGQAVKHMPQDRGVEVLMLPEFVERAMQ